MFSNLFYLGLYSVVNILPRTCYLKNIECFPFPVTEYTAGLSAVTVTWGGKAPPPPPCVCQAVLLGGIQTPLKNIRQDIIALLLIFVIFLLIVSTWVFKSFLLVLNSIPKRERKSLTKYAAGIDLGGGNMSQRRRKCEPNEVEK